MFESLHIFPMVNAIDFLYVKIYLVSCIGTSVDVMRSDTPRDLKPPHLQVGPFKLLQIMCIHRGVDLFCLLMFALSITEIQLCKVNAHFPGCFVPTI